MPLYTFKQDTLSEKLMSDNQILNNLMQDIQKVLFCEYKSTEDIWHYTHFYNKGGNIITGYIDYDNKYFSLTTNTEDLAAKIKELIRVAERKANMHIYVKRYGEEDIINTICNIGKLLSDYAGVEWDSSYDDSGKTFHILDTDNMEGEGLYFLAIDNYRETCDSDYHCFYYEHHYYIESSSNEIFEMIDEMRSSFTTKEYDISDKFMYISLEKVINEESYPDDYYIRGEDNYIASGCREYEVFRLYASKPKHGIIKVTTRIKDFHERVNKYFLEMTKDKYDELYFSLLDAQESPQYPDELVTV